jgi:hypothetical protein
MPGSSRWLSGSGKQVVKGDPDEVQIPSAGPDPWAFSHGLGSVGVHATSALVTTVSRDLRGRIKSRLDRVGLQPTDLVPWASMDRRVEPAGGV